MSNMPEVPGLVPPGNGSAAINIAATGRDAQRRSRGRRAIRFQVPAERNRRRGINGDETSASVTAATSTPSSSKYAGFRQFRVFPLSFFPRRCLSFPDDSRRERGTLRGTPPDIPEGCSCRGCRKDEIHPRAARRPPSSASFRSPSSFFLLIFMPRLFLRRRGRRARRDVAILSPLSIRSGLSDPFERILFPPGTLTHFSRSGTGHRDSAVPARARGAFIGDGKSPRNWFGFHIFPVAPSRDTLPLCDQSPRKESQPFGPPSWPGMGAEE